MFFSLFFLVTAVQHFLSVLKYVITEALPASLMAQLWQGMSPFWCCLDLTLFAMGAAPMGTIPSTSPTTKTLPHKHNTDVQFHPDLGYH